MEMHLLMLGFPSLNYLMDTGCILSEEGRIRQELINKKKEKKSLDQ